MLVSCSEKHSINYWDNRIIELLSELRTDTNCYNCCYDKEPVIQFYESISFDLDSILNEQLDFLTYFDTLSGKLPCLNNNEIKSQFGYMNSKISSKNKHEILSQTKYFILDLLIEKYKFPYKVDSFEPIIWSDKENIKEGDTVHFTYLLAPRNITNIIDHVYAVNSFEKDDHDVSLNQQNLVPVVNGRFHDSIIISNNTTVYRQARYLLRHPWRKVYNPARRILNFE